MQQTVDQVLRIGFRIMYSGTEAGCVVEMNPHREKHGADVIGQLTSIKNYVREIALKLLFLCNVRYSPKS